MSQTPKVLITGSTGFVGSHLVDSLFLKGWDVSSVVRPSSDTAQLEECGFKLIDQSDLLDSELGDYSDFQTLFYLAGITKTIDESQFRKVNADLVTQTLEALWCKNFRGHVVFVSSLAAAGPTIGDHLRQPGDSLTPVSAYGASKLRGEKAVLAWSNRLSVTILRPGAIYGPRERDIFEVLKVLRTGISAAFGNDIYVQMTHVSDVVAGLLAVANQEHCIGKTYFLNDPKAWKYSEVMKICGRLLGKRKIHHFNLPAPLGWGLARLLDMASRLAGKPLSPLTVDKMREISGGSWIADSSELTHDTGWRAEFALREGMHQTIHWYQKEGWL